MRRRLVLAALAALSAAAVLPAAPAAASGPPISAVVPPTAVPFGGFLIVVSGTGVTGPGGPGAYDFSTACQAVLAPPQEASLGTQVSCRVNFTPVATSAMTPGGVGAAAASSTPRTVSGAPFFLCIDVSFNDVTPPLVYPYAPPVCVPFS